jgi:hypothetical protein
VWLPCHLERLKSGTTVTPSHHFPSMKHTWSFYIFEIESIAHTSPQMVLSSHSMVFISLPKAIEFAFFFILLKSLCGALDRDKHTCIAYFAKSNNRSKEKDVIQSNQDVHVCEKFMVANQILLCSLKHISLYWDLEKFSENMRYLYSHLYFILFFLSYHLFFSFFFFLSSLSPCFTFFLSFL